MITSQQPILYYDSHCKFCTKSKQLAERLDSKTITYEPLTHETIRNFQLSLSITRHLSENVMYYKNRKGSLSYGSYAVFEYLKDKKGLFHVLGVMGEVRPISWIAKEVYSGIARNRYVISRFL